MCFQFQMQVVATEPSTSSQMEQLIIGDSSLGVNAQQVRLALEDIVGSSQVASVGAVSPLPEEMQLDLEYVTPDIGTMSSQASNASTVGSRKRRRFDSPPPAPPNTGMASHDHEVISVLTEHLVPLLKFNRPEDKSEHIKFEIKDDLDRDIAHHLLGQVSTLREFDREHTWLEYQIKHLQLLQDVKASMRRRRAISVSTSESTPKASVSARPEINVIVEEERIPISSGVVKPIAQSTAQSTPQTTPHTSQGEMDINPTQQQIIEAYKQFVLNAGNTNPFLGGQNNLHAPRSIGPHNCELPDSPFLFTNPTTPANTTLINFSSLLDTPETSQTDKPVEGVIINLTTPKPTAQTIFEDNTQIHLEDNTQDNVGPQHDIEPEDHIEKSKPL